MNIITDRVFGQIMSNPRTVTPTGTPPSENTIELNVTHEMLTEWNESKYSTVTAISPSRFDEGKEFDYDMLPDPRPSFGGVSQRAIAIQFKTLDSSDGSCDIGGIHSYRSGQYAKVGIDDDQLRDIQDPSEGVTYAPGELFYAIPLPIKRFRDNRYLRWTMFVDAFSLPADTNRLYLPVSYCPGAASKYVTEDDLLDLAYYHSYGFTSEISNSIIFARDWCEQDLTDHFDTWTNLDTRYQNLLPRKEPEPDNIGDWLPSEAEPVDKESPIPRTYGVFANRKEKGGVVAVSSKLRGWPELRTGLARPAPDYGRRLPTRTARTDGGNREEQAPFRPPTDWTFFVSTPTEWAIDADSLPEFE